MKYPLISVIIPVYKVEKYLNQCVESVLTQSLSDIEVILVDDGSPDNCPDMCDAYAAMDARIRVIHQKNLGLAGARNTGFRIAKGEYVAFLDSDDYVLPDAFAKLHAKAVEYDADIVFSQVQYFDDTLRQTVVANDTSSLPLFNDVKFEYSFDWRDVGADSIFSYKSFVVAWNKLCKKSFLDEIGANFPLGLIYEDNPFYFQTIFAAKRMAQVRERLICYRINRSGSIISDTTDGKNGMAIHMLGILAHIEMRLKKLLPGNLWPFFYAYAYSEICYKFSMVPNHLHEKYFALARGLLPPVLYWKFRGYVFAKNFKNGRRSLGMLIRFVRSPQVLTLQLFRNIPLFSIVKSDHLHGEYANIVAFGQIPEVAKGLLKLFTDNSFSLHNQITGTHFYKFLESIIAKNPRDGLIHSIIPASCNSVLDQKTVHGDIKDVKSLQVAQIASIRGSLAISSSILFIDFSCDSLAPQQLKAFFYTLNCLYPGKTIHYLRLTDTNEVVAAPVQGLTYRSLSSDKFTDLKIGLQQTLKGLETKKFHKYLRVRFFGITILLGRRR